ncbi:MAG: hypothetical protein IKK63_02735 [Clostridia bacterium]|nr:hypothetical protein [Clostridia bacterium]MBR3819177.1 hypothetical protein [Clostridia bacterium]
MKNYTKPAISFQPLNMATNVSDGCNMAANSAPYQCPVEIPNWPGETVFTAYACTWATNKPEEFDICYHGPVGIISVFGS